MPSPTRGLLPYNSFISSDASASSYKRFCMSSETRRMLLDDLFDPRYRRRGLPDGGRTRTYGRPSPRDRQSAVRAGRPVGSLSFERVPKIFQLSRGTSRSLLLVHEAGHTSRGATWILDAHHSGQVPEHSDSALGSRGESLNQCSRLGQSNRDCACVDIAGPHEALYLRQEQTPPVERRDVVALLV